MEVETDRLQMPGSDWICLIQQQKTLTKSIDLIQIKELG